MATLQHTDELYHILEDEICALKILPGEALSENQLCKRFGVSRTPIRSVLQRLEQNRFVQIIPCKGTIVTAIDTGVVDQLIFQRVAVEGMVFRDFVQSCSPMEILAVEHLYNMLLEAAAGRSDPENFQPLPQLRPCHARVLVPQDQQGVPLGADDPSAGRLFPLYPSGHRGCTQRVQRRQRARRDAAHPA